MKIKKIADWLDKEKTVTNIYLIIHALAWSVYGAIIWKLLN